MAAQYARIIPDAIGDHQVQEFSHLHQAFVPLRSFVFRANAEAAVARIEQYHARCDRAARHCH